MSDSICDKELCTADEVMEWIRFVMEFAIFMPADASVTASSNSSLGDDPASLHSRYIDNVETFTHWKPISTISFEQDTISPIQGKCSLLVIYVQWNLFTIMSRNPELLMTEVFAQYLRTSFQFDFLNECLCFLIMLVFVLSLVYERWREHERELFRLVVLI